VLVERNRGARVEPLVLEPEALDAAQRVALDHGAVLVQLSALDREAEQPVELGWERGAER
jgi:hypothetical protein